jgi:hypothetical protein
MEYQIQHLDELSLHSEEPRSGSPGIWAKMWTSKVGRFYQENHGKTTGLGFYPIFWTTKYSQ